MRTWRSIDWGGNEAEVCPELVEGYARGYRRGVGPGFAEAIGGDARRWPGVRGGMCGGMLDAAGGRERRGGEVCAEVSAGLRRTHCGGMCGAIGWVAADALRRRDAGAGATREGSARRMADGGLRRYPKGPRRHYLEMTK